METPAALRLFLPQDTIFLRADDGLVLRRGDRRILVKGRSIAEQFDKIAPLLSGERTLAEVLGMDSEAQAAGSAIGRLLVELVDRRFLLARSEGDRAALPAGERARWRDIIAFLGHYVDNPITAFRAFRAGRVLLLGHGCMHRSFARSMAVNGIRELHVGRIESVADQADAQDVEAALADIGMADVRVARSADVQGELATFDAVCYVADVPDLAAVDHLSCACRAVGVPLFTGTVLGDAARVGPLHVRGSPCLNCLLLRLGDGLEPKQAGMLWRRVARGKPAFGASTRPCSTPSLRVAGNALALRVFRFLAGVPEAEEGHLPRVESISSLTLESRSAVLLPHPACESCREPAAPRPVRDTGRITTAAFAQRALFDRDVGVFAQFDDDHLDQVPVFRSRVATHGWRDDGLRTQVTGNSLLSNERAREDALLNAARWYAKVLYEREGWGLAPDASSLAEDRQGFGVHASLPAAVTATARDARRTLTVYAEPGGRSLRIAAGELLPLDPRGGFSSDQWFAGIACGRSAAQARAQARAALVGTMAARAIARGVLGFALVDDWSASLAPHVALLRSVDPGTALGMANIDDVWVACEPGNESVDAVLTTGGTRDECLSQCLADALALRAGGASERALRAWLPDLREFDGSRPQLHAGPAIATSLAALLPVEASPPTVFGFVDLTPEDLRLAGLHVWKAACLTRPI
jgi:hypothetical protein